jgi:predicted Zn-dependent peptidase
MFQFTHTRLNSGLNVILVPMPGVKSATVLVLNNTGSRYEKPREEGIAHFFEHMVFKGTKNYPSAQILASSIDAIGADFNAFTSKEYTGYYVKSASRHIEKSLDVVSDMLLRPLLKSEDIEREKGVIIEEINMYLDTPMRLVGNLFEQMAYEGSGLSHDIIGSKESVSQLTAADFRRFLKQWYGLGNLVLVIAGDESVVTAPSTLSKIEEYFGKEHEERPKDKIDIEKRLSGKTPGGKGPFSSHRLHVENKATEQAHLVLGWPGLRRGDPDRYALALLNVIIGGNMSSRLFMEVREKRGLCYYVRSDIDYFHDAGLFGASAGVDPKRIEEALQVIIAEFMAILSGEKPLTEADLQKAKEYATGTTVLGFEDSRSVAQYFGLRQVLLDTIESPDDLLDKLRAVSLPEVEKVAHRLIKKGEMRLAVVGPYKDKRPFEEIVKLG